MRAGLPLDRVLSGYLKSWVSSRTSKNERVVLGSGLERQEVGRDMRNGHKARVSDRQSDTGTVSVRWERQ